MQKYSEITFYFLIVFDYHPNFGIGDFVADTTSVAIVEHILLHHEGFHPLTVTDDSVHHQFGAVCGERYFQIRI